MNVSQSQAWEHLTPLEKSVLSLTLVSEKTKQEASIVLNIYPYKFTEIYSRARKLFLVFTDYYEEFSTLLPPVLEQLGVLQHFLPMVLVNRRKPSELAAIVPDFLELNRPQAITSFWHRILRQVQYDPTPHAQAFYGLLRTFDQWNNFRILPPEYRDPSPFPRRRNREFKKIHAQLNSISELGWSTIENQFGTTRPPLAFIPVVGELFSSIQIRLTKNSLSYCTNNKIPVFSRKEVAQSFAEDSYDFHNLSRVSTYSAQKYWAHFRLALQSALNHDALLKIRPGSFREFSTRDKLFLRKASEKTSVSPLLPRTRTPDSQFY